MTWVFLATSGVLGLVIGSFLNVVIHRGPALWKLVDDEARTGNLAFPSSYCPACKEPIRAHQLIPLFSYIALGGKCANCAAPISFRYPVVEIMGAAAGVIAAAHWGVTGAAFAAAIFFWALIALAAIDLETGYLPDAITLPLIAAGLIANGFGIFTPFSNALIGATIGYLAFAGIALAFKKLRGIEGLGLGDAKLLAAIGAWLGWASLAPVVLLAALVALLGIGVANFRGAKIGAQTPSPFGPALAAAAAIALIANGAQLPMLDAIFP